MKIQITYEANIRHVVVYFNGSESDYIGLATSEDAESLRNPFTAEERRLILEIAEQAVNRKATNKKEEPLIKAKRPFWKLWGGQ